MRWLLRAALVCGLLLGWAWPAIAAEAVAREAVPEPTAVEVALGTLEHDTADANALDSDEIDLNELDLDGLDLDELDLDELNLDEAGLAGLDETEAGDSPGGGGELDLGTVSVTGVASLAALLGDSRAVTVVDAAQFGSAQSLGEVLERLPGVDARYDGGAGQLAMLQVRGARAEQVLVLVDGAPVGYGSTDLSQIPLGAVARVELLRGPQAARFGTGALGGVLNIITQAPPKARAAASEAPPLDASWFKLTLGTGSLGRAEVLARRADASAYLSHMQARNNFDFTRVGGESAMRINNEAQQDDLWLSWRAGRRTFRAGATSMQRGVPGGAEQPTTLAQLARQRVWCNMQGRGLSADFSLTQSRFTDPEPYLHTGALDYEDTLVQAQAAWGTLADQRGQWGVKPQFAYIDSSKWGEHTRAGLDAHYYYEHPAGGWLWQLDAGLLADSDAGLDPVARLGASRQLDVASQLYAASSYAVRHPAFDELYYLDTGGVRGNPDLEPERVFSAELGWRYARRLSASVAAFYNSYEDSIVWLPVSSYLVEARNTGRAEVGGLEGALELPLGRGFSWQGAYTWLPLAEFAAGTPLAGRSEHHANTRLGYSAAGWTSALACDYTGSLPADQFGNLVIKPRTLWNAELTRELGQRQLSLSATNLFSEDARDSWNYPLPGREITLSYRVEF
jgi:outer membrane cobalamin receptor